MINDLQPRSRHRSVPNETTDCVYVGHSQRQQAFKIGRGDPPSRFDNHRTACPDIRFIGAVRTPSSQALEQRILAHFARWRQGKSEWLDDEPEVRQWVDSFAAHPNVAKTYGEIMTSYSLPSIWPWWNDPNPAPSLEDESGQALLPIEVGLRDYQQPKGRGKGQTSSLTEDWYTHPGVVEAVRELFDGEIDLDPFSCQEANRTVRATRFFTAEVDGLIHTWHGRLLMNPPWGGSGERSVKKRAVDKLIRSYIEGTVSEAVVVLNANATTTKWFAPLFAFPICFPAYRISHYGPGGAGGSPNTGTVLIYLGTRVTDFTRIFSRFGNIVQRIASADDTAMSAAEDWDPDEAGELCRGSTWTTDSAATPKS